MTLVNYYFNRTKKHPVKNSPKGHLVCSFAFVIIVTFGELKGQNFFNITQLVGV